MILVHISCARLFASLCTPIFPCRHDTTLGDWLAHVAGGQLGPGRGGQGDRAFVGTVLREKRER